MESDLWKESLQECTVTYTLEMEGRLIVVENVPARVNQETGEQLFSPETVQRIQKMVGEQKKPNRVIEVPVFEFA